MELKIAHFISFSDSSVSSGARTFLPAAKSAYLPYGDHEGEDVLGQGINFEEGFCLECWNHLTL